MTLSIQFVKASDFGVKPDTGKDSTEAVRNAIRHCKENGIRRIVFEQGRYDFKHSSFIEQYDLLMKHGAQLDLGQSTEQKVIAFQLEEMEEFEWDGGFSQFVFHGLVQPFAFIRCRNLKIHRFTMDWEQPLFSIGVVSSADEMSALIDLQEGHLDEGAVPVAALMNVDRYSPYPLIGSIESFSQVDRTEQPSPNRLRLHYENPQRLKPGMQLLLRHILNYRMGILLYECMFVEVQDVTLLYAPGMGIIGHRSEHLSFVRLTVKPGEGRILSTNTDATHFISCKGKIKFADCYFESMGDDAVNVHGFYLKVKKIVDDHTVEVFVDITPQSEKLDFPDVGDHLEIVRSQTLEPYSTNEVAGIQLCPDGTLILQMSRPIPKDLAESDLIANLSRTASLSVKNCTVRNNRARAFLVQTRDVEIENCTFDHCTGTAIHVNCSIYWYESLNVDRVSIKNNQFLECAYGAGTIGKAEAMVVSVEAPEPVVGAHSHIQFIGNVIHGRNGLALRIESAKEVCIEENEFYSTSSIALFDHSYNVVMQNNRFDRDNTQIFVGAGCLEKTIILRDETCKIKKTP
ncbi:hypothetical protein B1748_14415 [Paenibacillus sp. MY03]|uniref:right-handed parallel beta-helix repeat-containing protein n=1 Tax=Paenibacillus sp. MY03 TaxID=302980 RepID=UPI000B3C9048|nr:right-handed parallel beta-helix repeat-containing protein [Paenibacillus sp. MY03]OUS76003.1 hypothetical protein B1748_14415 [Paenibacillus sp. MY03]